MKVLLLSDINSSHTQKWVISLAERGIEVGIFSLRSLTTEAYKNKQNIKIFASEQFEKSGFLKVNYLKALPVLRKAIKEFTPDTVHAHYATSYGLLGALSGFHPLIVSVWGSDVYDFPCKSFFHKKLLKYNFKKADKILSTSKVMAIETSKYTEKDITVTPFGIDIEKFKPVKQTASDLIIGTIKMLEEKYGIAYLIQAFAIVKKRQLLLPLKLCIVGSGSLLDKLKLLVKSLNLEESVNFIGFVEPEKIPACHNSFSIEVYPSISNSESFGVSVLEASACEKSVVVSNVGGLPEVVEDGVTGIVVPATDPDKLAQAIEKLLLDETLRLNMGKNGRKRVEKLYNWNDNVEQMISIYRQVAKSH